MHRREVASIKGEFPKGTRIRLINMGNDIQSLPSGSEGTVTEVDDIGTIHMSWDCGSSLGLIVEEDSFIKI